MRYRSSDNCSILPCVSPRATLLTTVSYLRHTSSNYNVCVVASRPSFYCLPLYVHASRRVPLSRGTSQSTSSVAPYALLYDATDTGQPKTMRQHTQTEVDSTGLQQAQITIAVLTIAWFFILLRTWTRTWVISNFGWDDATMILAGVSLSLLLRAPWN